jgi:hypothetical protein
MSALISALPPVGLAIGVLQIMQSTSVAVLENTVCSLPHSSHETL